MSRLLTWCCNLCYLLILVLAAPIITYRALALGKYREGWAEKLFGNVPQRQSLQPAAWFHAVSVGEVLQLLQIVKRFREAQPGYEIIVSCTTSTGKAVAEEKFSDCLVCYYPLDFSWAVRRAMKRLRPDLMVLVELELWPNFILESERRHVPLALINGRISEKSFNGYRKLRPLLRRLLSVFSVLATQSDLYAERLKTLGAPADRIHVTGSIKFDGIQTERNNERTSEIRSGFRVSADDYVFIAGSTQFPEEKYALDAYRELKTKFTALRLVLVPRHKERFAEVASLIEAEGFTLIRRSEIKEGKARNSIDESEDPVLLLDTLGELNACWGLANFAFVGGSLTNRGGQNMIEPAAYAAVVTFGPNTRNFKDVVDLLLAGDAAEVVRDETELRQRLEHYLTHPETGRERGERARELVCRQQGATKKTIDLLTNLLSSNSESITRAA